VIQAHSLARGKVFEHEALPAASLTSKAIHHGVKQQKVSNESSRESIESAESFRTTCKTLGVDHFQGNERWIAMHAL